MSLLIVEIPPRRLRDARPEGAAAEHAAAVEWSYVHSDDGRSVARSGRAAAALLPKATGVVAVADAADVAWHRVTLPRVGRAKLRAALAGLLEEQLLGDPKETHLALGAADGAARWVAALDRAWIARHLAALDDAGLAVDRVVPSATPVDGDAGATGWFDVDTSADDAEAPRLVLATADGVCTLGTRGNLARHLLAGGATPAFRAAPAVAAAAERWLGAPVPVVSRAEHLLERALADDVNLLQFDLAPRHRGTRVVRDGLRRVTAREFRWVRWGVAAALLVQLAGLNVQAWQQQRAVADRRESLVQLLKSAHPQVRTVLDAPLQMQRETEALRAAAGRAGPADLEPLLAAASQAWPDGAAPAQMLRYDGARLAFSAAGFGDAQLAPMRERLRAAGYDAALVDGRVQISPAGGGTR